MKTFLVNKKVISISFSVLILLLLLMTGPVKAFIVGFSILDNFITKGEEINFQVSAEVEQGEILDIQNFTLLIEGPQIISCEFLPDGTLLNSCPNIQLEQIESTANYQYGYGFLPGILKYSITLNSETLPAGEYQSGLLIFTQHTSFESSKEIITISEPDLLGSCSLRAADGEATFQGEHFSSNKKLTLYSTSGNANDGQGSITAQKGRNRLSYTFTVQKPSK